jgi:Green fluorescent protein
MTFMPKFDEFQNAKTFDAELEGTVNGSPINLTGSGKYDAKMGITVGEYELHNIPQGFSPFLLGVCLVTGYPNVCACNGEVSNPFGSSPYKYERDISLGDFGSLQLETEVQFRGSHLISRFRLCGEVDVPSLGQVEPFEETWQISDNDIRGDFVMRWPIDANRKLSARATSNYHPALGAEPGKKLVRTLDLRTQLSGRTLKLTQLSSLRA